MMNKLLVFSLAALSAFADATTYYIYSCPLESSGSSLSSSNSKDCPNSKRDIIPPYGIRHTYIQVGFMCFDWGNWNYTRQVDCNGSELSCCVQRNRKEYTGITSCANRIDEFETAWRNDGKSYNVLSWNCQHYTDKMKEFLNICGTADGIIG